LPHQILKRADTARLIERASERNAAGIRWPINKIVNPGENCKTAERRSGESLAYGRNKITYARWQQSFFADCRLARGSGGVNLNNQVRRCYCEQEFPD
jgi:hypothetical protein